MNTYMAGILSGVGFSDVIDVIIISFAVYKLLGFIRMSRAEQLAKGLLILIIASFISDTFDFYTVNWILTKVLDVGIIALVVVFQPELRRGLEYLGRGKFGSKQFSMDKERMKETSDTLVRAVEYFAATRTGALIVIERETALSDIAETGIIMNSALSESLIENLFYKGSPLHDGAVILRDDRIYAAGCVLPLSENNNLSKDLGTRHRAGVGITEVSDAVVLIVSEETGIISMAVDGRLSRFLDLKTVDKMLLNHYMSRLDRKRPGRDWIGQLFRGGRNE
ncbi:MAG TPA: TIGR00159 family protein [Clostridiales bacterium]|nr:TIGR00159 family protein [Clostridiales bacterium]